MYLTVIAWMYVVLMMSVAEATSPVGTLLGAVVTFLLYGVLPLSIVVYLMRSPARRRAIKAQQAAERTEAERQSQGSSVPGSMPLPARSDQPDAGSEAPARVASLSAGTPGNPAVREKP